MSKDNVCHVCGCDERRPLEDALTAQLAEARAEIERLKAELAAAPRWVKADEFTPEPYTQYLVFASYDDEDEYVLTYATFMQYNWSGGKSITVSHVLANIPLPTD